jgi:hypothetical protein
MTKHRRSKPSCKVEYVDDDLYVFCNGLCIAKSGNPGEAHNKWIALEPGYTVYGGLWTSKPTVVFDPSACRQH